MFVSRALFSAAFCQVRCCSRRLQRFIRCCHQLRSLLPTAGKLRHVETASNVCMLT